MNCDSPASASSRTSLRTDCNSARCPVSLKYRWSLLKNDGNNSNPKWSTQIHFKHLLGTKVDSKNLVIKEQMLEPGSPTKSKLTLYLQTAHLAGRYIKLTHWQFHQEEYVMPLSWIGKM